MAAKKKAPASKSSPSSRPGALRRDTSVTPDPLDTERTLPARPPELRDMSPALQREVKKRVGTAGKDVFGSPIRFQDAVDNRVASIERSLARTESGVPRHHKWYTGHQSSVVDVAESTGISPSSTADASAILSQRNSPVNELKSSQAASWIAANPNTSINVDSRVISDVASKSTGKTKLDKPLVPGTVRLGDMTPRQVASVAQVSMGRDDVVPPEVTSLYRHAAVAGRPTQAKAVEATRGTPMSDLVGPAPKLKSYRRGMSLASASEDSYNAEVLWRRRSQDPNQISLFPASALLPEGHVPDSSTAEDYVMNYNSAKTAAAKGQGKSGTPESIVSAARGAQDTVQAAISKGKPGTGLPSDLATEEALHSFNNAVTQEASKQIGVTSLISDDDGVKEVYEHILPRAAQPLTWMEDRTYELKEDDDYNKQVALSSSFESARNKLQGAQGFFDFDNPAKPKVQQGRKLRYNADEREAIGADLYGRSVLHPDDPAAKWHE